jgi:uncharacterized cysteine cluster protein YcgN (CxxCxxCC family)
MTFWRDKALDELTHDEWELLCDGCAQCCLVQLEDDVTGEVHATAIACDLLDPHDCRCTRYPDRQRLVAECQTVRPDNIDAATWLPETCAYRRIANGQDLEWWHHLVSGSRATVHEAGISVRGRTVARRFVPPGAETEYVLNWVDR